MVTMPATALVLPPPLRAGEVLTRDEFLRRWDAMPELKRAELINGVVQMASPIGALHRNYQFLLNVWVGQYTIATPGVQGGANGTWLMTDVDVPQPDLDLRILPVAGGQSRDEGSYPAGAPELIVEVSESTHTKDAGEKLRLYERNGVREYITVRPRRRQIAWRVMVRRKYTELSPAKNGIYRSRVFPGLWLDPVALWNEDLAGLAATVQAGVATLDHARFIQALARRGRE
jgi:Uma2 family endonuclease